MGEDDVDVHYDDDAGGDVSSKNNSHEIKFIDYF